MGVSLWASAYPGRAEDCVDDVDHEEDAAKWRGESSGWDVDADAGGGLGVPEICGTCEAVKSI